MRIIQRFLTDERGALTVEYAVLCAVTAGLGAATVAVVQAGAADAGADLSANSEYSAQVVQPRVRVIYDEVKMSSMYSAMGIYEDSELGTLTAYADEWVDLVETYSDQVSLDFKERLTDFNTAIDLVWAERELARPIDGTWDEAAISALPGGADGLANTFYQ
ncbi:Flp family type IVb pilin [Jannaschia sp. KMU-145]|uniref:Flp family type IVb pilin n=1 Tax=Jannaschia halovivens TaxID=3388667 RepID=UPI00396AF433